MKNKTITYCLLIALMLRYTDTLSATPIPPYTTTYVPFARTDIIFDGGLDQWYGPEQITDWVFPDQQPGYGIESDFKSSFHLCWDSSFLYLLAIQMDDVEENFNFGYSNPWEFDNVEVYLQLDTNTSYTAYDDVTEQLRICRGLDSVETSGQTGRNTWEYYMDSEYPGGWVTEVAIPWECASTGGTLPEPVMNYIEDAVGFDFLGSDSDNSDGDLTVGNRDYQTAWDLEGNWGGDAEWQDVTTFGYITFEIPSAIKVNTTGSTIAYPNPTGNSITFDISGMENVEIYSITGTKVMSQLTTGMVDISSLKSGIYVARIGNDSVRFVKD